MMMMYYIVHLELGIGEEMKTRSGEPRFADKASAAECCYITVEEVENHVG